MKRKKQVRRPGDRGFTLVELLVSSSLSLVLVGVTLAVFVYLLRSWHEVELRMQADSDVNIAMSRMVYGMGDRRGLRCAAGVPTITTSGDGWTLKYSTGGTPPQTNSFTYSKSARNLVFNPGSQIAGRDLSFAWVGTQPLSLVVTLRVDRVDGTLNARRELGTTISFRNL